MDKDTTPTPSMPPGAKYRGAVVEDLQLPPAFCLDEDAPLQYALEAAYEREFDHLPILNSHRKPIGYLSIPTIKSKMEKNQLNPSEPVIKQTTHFPLSSKTHPYTIIQPLTPLEELESFFDKSGTDFALVTDVDRKWVLAVATRTDLEEHAVEPTGVMVIVGFTIFPTNYLFNEVQHDVRRKESHIMLPGPWAFERVSISLGERDGMPSWENRTEAPRS